MKGVSSDAVLAPGRPPLSYYRLCGQIENVISFLNDHGLGRDGRIAAVLPNGPEMAVLFLSVIAGSAFVPLAPSYTEEEYETYLSDLRVSALIVASGSDLRARSVAIRNKIPVIEMTPHKGDDAAGLFDLKWSTGDRPKSGRSGFSGPKDVALVLVTSGTSSQAKVAPLSQDNIFAAAWYVASTLELTSADRCLNIMPMYHITGLVSPVLASILAGGSVLCTTEVSTDDFEAWLRNYSPTWYSAVPAIHQAIVDKAERSCRDLKGTSLRFVRSTTSPLFEPLFLRLEQLFGIPVVQSYGLTEALPISSTPLNPYRRKPASVGTPVSEIAIVDELGQPLGCGNVGEILVRGPQVFDGYEGHLDANESAFTDGWFRTGDTGYLDEENYLHITGRLKEMINRGGQKVSPFEVETVLMGHSAVREAAVFSIPHGRLGEAVAAAVVLKDLASVSEAELQRYMAKHLTHFKVPQQVIITDSITKGPTGKFRRSGLSEHFRELLKPVFARPSTETQKIISTIWSDVLKVGTVGKNDNFFALGGDSLAIAEMFALIEKAFGVLLPPSAIYQSPTMERFAEDVEQRRPQKAPSCLVSMRTEGSRPPLICVPPIAGDVLVYHQLLKYLEPDQPVYGLVSSEARLQSSMEEIAGRYLSEILAEIDGDNFFLIGFSSGGLMAFEIARQLYLKGKAAPFLGILDTSCLHYATGQPKRPASAKAADLIRNLPYWVYYYLPFWLRHYLKAAADRTMVIFGCRRQGSEEPAFESIDRSPQVIKWLHRQVLQGFPAHVTFYRAKAQGLILSSLDMGWGHFADTVRVRPVPGSHTGIVKEPYVQSLAKLLNEDLSATVVEELP